MSFASHGVRTAVRKAAKALAQQDATRSINFSTNLARRLLAQPLAHTPFVGRSQALQLFTHSRPLLSRFFNHLTAPGLRLPIHQGSRSLQPGFSGQAQSFAHAARSFAPRELQVQNVFLPRGPRPVSRVSHVGLGTARNFSSSRPIFQNLVENVPVVARAMYEADLDVKLSGPSHDKRFSSIYKKSTPKSKEMMKSIQKAFYKPEQVADIDYFFPSTPVPAVTTSLLIPLAPTPTARLPLDLHAEPFSGTHPRLLPLSQIGSVHASYSTHALRVSALFLRLDQADVWARGVKCTAYAEPSACVDKDGKADCTILRVDFVGWSKAEVRAVIGESGTGWCALEETREDEDDSSDDEFSVTSSEDFTSSFGTDGGTFIDPAESFVLPTLDFSLSFLSSSSATVDLARTSTSSPGEYWLDTPSDLTRSSSVASFVGPNWVGPPSADDWVDVRFSSQFADRSGTFSAA